MSQLYRLSFADIQNILNHSEKHAEKSLNISILRNVVLDPISIYLRFLALENGYWANICFGEYDNVFQESVFGSANLLAEDTDFVFVFLQLDTLSWKIGRNFPALSSDEVKQEFDRICNTIHSILIGIRKQTKGVILWHSFELSSYPNMGILDCQGETFQTATIQKLNSFARNCLREVGNAYYVDMNLGLLRLGFSEFYDWRHWHLGKAPFSRLAYREIAFEDFKYIKALTGKNKKCVVLDCDDTLWGGVIGEDGLAGIKIGKHYPGSAFSEFQEEVVNLYHKGIILAICSKNNSDDVWDVFRNHPDMIIREDHISAFQINWEDKATNMRRIASHLNIGLDSMVFIDDSDFEINLIHQELPEVATILLPRNRVSEYRNILLSSGYFDSLTLSKEDKLRGEMYKADIQRKELIDCVVNIEEYCKFLEMTIEVNFADEFSIPRIAQLTQKTNQFNLTTHRYSEDDINFFVKDEVTDVIYIRVNDRFGDLGIVGVAIIRYRAQIASLDTFLLSCRALGRKIENVFLNICLKIAQERGASTIIGQYSATKKNSQVRNFYSSNGFQVIESDDTKCINQFDLSTFKYDQVDYMKAMFSNSGIL